MELAIQSFDGKTSIKNVVSVIANLTSGVIEVLDNHSPLVGKIKNNTIAVTYSVDMTKQQSFFFLSDSVFSVVKMKNGVTEVSVFSTGTVEINSENVSTVKQSIENIGKEIKTLKDSQVQLLTQGDSEAGKSTELELQVLEEQLLSKQTFLLVAKNFSIE